MNLIDHRRLTPIQPSGMGLHSSFGRPTAEATPFALSAARKPRRIMFLSTNMGVGGGAEEQVIDLAYEFKSRQWEVQIVSLLPPSAMPPDFDQRGIPLLHLNMRRAIPDPRGLLRLRRYLRQYQPDIVHAHMNHANLVARAVRLIQPYPVLVSTLHALNMAGVQHDRGPVFEVAHRLTDGLSERTTAICHAAADYYLQKQAVSAQRMMVVHNGIDTDRYLPKPDVRARLRRELGVENDFVWIAAGRLELAKAYPTMLNAVACLKSLPGPSRRRTLLICGKGTLLDELQAMAVRLKVDDQVRFLGLRRDLPELLSAADAFALSSDSEGLPLVLLQAATARLPIVATKVGGNPEVVTHGLNGLLSTAGDPGAFADAMAKIETMQPADRLLMGQAGQRHVLTHFQRETVVDQWIELFNELYSANDGKPRRRAARHTCMDLNSLPLKD